MLKRTKEEKLSSLIKKLDTQVSLYVRLNAADQNGTVKCISCNDKLFWSEADTAHYQDRDNMATRYYLPNLAPACQNCNRFNHYQHIRLWDEKYTAQERSDLRQKAKSMMKFTRPELEEMIRDFTEKVKAIRKQKGL